MKKLLLIIPAVLILAAACSQQPSVQQNTQTTPTPSPTPIQQTDPSASLKTYTNTKYGFELKYDSAKYDFSTPINGEVFRLTDIKSAQESAKCQCGEVAVLTVSVYPNSQNLSLETFAKNNFTGTSHNLANLETKTFLGAQMITWGEIDSSRLFAHNGNMFLITPASGFDDVMNTFVFTNKASTDSNSKTYTSNYGYQVTYSSDYTLETSNSAKVGLRSKLSAVKTALPDITIQYFSDLTQLPNYKPGMKNADDYIAQSGSDKLIYNVFGGKNKNGLLTYSFTNTGLKSIYTELTPHNNHFFQISFFLRETSDQLTTSENDILTSFKFTK